MIETSNKKPTAVNQAEFRREVSRLAAVANKRIARLEKNKLQSSPAYQKLVEGGKPKFGVKGKTYNEVQSELSKINKFLNSQTSTIRGLNSNLKTMAQNTGVKYKNLADLRSKANAFFTLARKVEEYLRTVEDLGSAIGYNQIWDVINEYSETNRVDLDNSETDINSITNMVDDLINGTKGKEDIGNPFDNNKDWVFLF